MSPQTDENTWSDYVAMMRRRWRPTLAVAAIVALSSIYIAYSLPPIYRSSATILIEEQGIPGEIVQTTINAYAEQLIQTIHQRVVSAPRIVDMIHEFDLYPDDRDLVPEEDLIQQFRTDTKLTPRNVTSVHSRTGRETIVTFGFQIAFDYGDPVKARDITQELANQFVAENSMLRGEAAARTTAFLDTEAADLEKRLGEAAERIARFKERNANNLPEDQAVNLRTWERLRDELTGVDGRIREVRETKALLETEIADTPRYRPVMDESGDAVLGAIDRLAQAQQELIRLQGRYSESHPDIIALKREIATLSGSPSNIASLAQEVRIELQISRQELAAARDAYSANHPDVIRLANTVGALERQLTNLEREIANASTITPIEPNNPVYLQLRTRISTAAIELRDLGRRRNDLVARIDELDRRMSVAPQAESDYLALTQERDVLLERYRELRGLGSDAALGQALETGQSGERFTILEPARVPANPVSPNRMSLSFLGLVLAMALGLGVASLTEAMDTKVRGRRDVHQLLAAPPIGIIPYVESPADTKRRITTNVATGAVFTTAIAYVAATVLSS